MPTPTVENYVKAIYLEHQRGGAEGGELVPLGRLASALGVTPGTVTTMVKALEEARLVHYEPRQGVRLSTGGQKLALHVLRRHRLIELFLVRVLNVDWAEVHAEAEDLEHALSDKLLERIDQYLGRPAFDPHGDPIPTARGTVPRPALVPLDEAAIGQPVRVARLVDQEAGFLRFATAHGLTPGARVRVVSHNPGETLTVCVEDQPEQILAGSRAEKVLVSDAGEANG